MKMIAQPSLLLRVGKARRKIHTQSAVQGYIMVAYVPTCTQTQPSCRCQLIVLGGRVVRYGKLAVARCSLLLLWSAVWAVLPPKKKNAQLKNNKALRLIHSRRKKKKFERLPRAPDVHGSRPDTRPMCPDGFLVPTYLRLKSARTKR